MVRDRAAGRISRTVTGVTEEVRRACREVRESHGHLATVVEHLNARRCVDMEVHDDARAGQPGLMLGDDTEYLTIIAARLRSLHREAGAVRDACDVQTLAGGGLPSPCAKLSRPIRTD